jgi:hypothetical protein
MEAEGALVGSGHASSTASGDAPGHTTRMPAAALAR